jgi:hypothetical protein
MLGKPLLSDGHTSSTSLQHILAMVSRSGKKMLFGTAMLAFRDPDNTQNVYSQPNQWQW